MEPVSSITADSEDSRADTLVTTSGPVGEPPLTARVVRGAAWVFAGNMAGRGLQLITVVVLARLLTPQDFGLPRKLENADRALPTQPLGYLEFLKLSSNARLILTDSGGLQEEACILQVPCLTLRANTERPSTITAGWNRLVGTDRQAIIREARQALSDGAVGSPVPLWDGRASERIVETLVRQYLPNRTSL